MMKQGETMGRSSELLELQQKVEQAIWRQKGKKELIDLGNRMDWLQKQIESSQIEYSQKHEELFVKAQIGIKNSNDKEVKMNLNEVNRLIISVILDDEVGQ